MVRPHFLEVVEGADFGPEDMNNNVSGVQNDPIRLAQTFDSHVFLSGLFELFPYFFSQGADVAGGSPGGDYNVIRKGRVLLEWDRHNIQSLVRIQRFFDEGFGFFRAQRPAGRFLLNGQCSLSLL